MPRSRLLLPGIVLLLSAACATGPASPTNSSTPTPATAAVPSEAPGGANAPWALDLDLAGGRAGHVNGTAPSDATVHNDCTGVDSPKLGSWAATMAFTVGQTRYALYMRVKDYRGAAVFNSGVNIEISSEDQAKAWQNESGDQVTFTVGPGQQSGQLQAVLSNVGDTTKKLTVAGHWSCRP